MVSNAYVHLVEVGAAVTVGGLTVHPGDLIHADEHGVTTVPLEIARQLPAAAYRVEAAERQLINYANSPQCNREGLAQLYGNVD